MNSLTPADTGISLLYKTDAPMHSQLCDTQIDYATDETTRPNSKTFI